MKDTLSNKLTTFKATLAVADLPENESIWKDNPPLAFDEGLTAIRPAVAGLASAGAEQSQDTTGSTEALRTLRDQFERALHPLARATFRCLGKLGRTEDAAKVDITPSDLHNARATALAATGETILDLAEPLSTGNPAPGEKFGITAASVAAVDDLWSRYSAAVGAPAGARSTRKAKTDALPGKFAAVEEKFAELDDLIVQFGTTVLGRAFVDAWFNARQVVALGRRAAKPKPPAPPAPKP